MKHHTIYLGCCNPCLKLNNLCPLNVASNYYIPIVISLSFSKHLSAFWAFLTHAQTTSNNIPSFHLFWGANCIFLLMYRYLILSFLISRTSIYVSQSHLHCSFVASLLPNTTVHITTMSKCLKKIHINQIGNQGLHMAPPACLHSHIQSHLNYQSQCSPNRPYRSF